MKKSWISRSELEEIVHFFDRELEEFANNEGLPIYDYNKQPIEWLDKNDFKTMFSDLSDSDTEALKSSQQDINKSRLKHCFFKVKELEKFLKDKYPEQYEIYNKNSQWIQSREKEKRISSEDKWITGQEILKRWNAPEFNLLQAFERGLYAFYRKTGDMLYTQIVRYFDEDPNNPGVVVFEVVHDKRGEPTSSFYSGHEDSWIRTLLDDTKIIFKLSHVETYEQQHGINQQGHAPEPLSIKPGKDKEPGITDPEAVAYYNFTKCGLDWIPTGEKACPEKYKQYMDGEIKKETFRSQVRRLAERYAKKNNLSLKKGPAPTR